MTKYDNSNFENWSLETRALHVGQDLDGNSNSRNVPIHQTTSYVFDSAEHAANRFNLSDAGPIYTRLTGCFRGTHRKLGRRHGRRRFRFGPGRADRSDYQLGFCW